MSAYQRFSFRIVLYLLGLCLSSLLFSCKERIEPLYGFSFQKSVGSSGDDFGTAAIQDAAKGYVLAGSILPLDDSKTSFFASRIDSTGLVEWTNSYGGANDDAANAVILTQEGGLLLAGTTQSFGSGFKDVMLVKLKPTGELEWAYAYGGAMSDEGFSVIQADNGDFYCLGAAQSFGVKNKDAFLLRMNPQGVLVWAKTFSTNILNIGRSLCKTPDGALLLTGYSGSNADVNYDIFAAKVSLDGEVLWAKSYGGPGFDQAFSVIPTADGGFVIGGGFQNFENGYNSDLLAFKIDANGLPIWNQIIGGGGVEQCYGIAQDATGNFFLTGVSGSFSANSGDLFLVKLKPDGVFDWAKTYGSTATDEGRCIIPAIGEGLFILGSSRSFNERDNNLYVIKTDRNGNTGACNQLTPATGSYGYDLKWRDVDFAVKNVDCQSSPAAVTTASLLNPFKTLCETKAN